MSSAAQTSLTDSKTDKATDSATALGMTNAGQGRIEGGVANPHVIDVFGIDGKTGDVLLVMNEPRPWTGGDEQLHELQEKFNTYASFILDGEMVEAHPEIVGKLVRIQLRCSDMPDPSALNLVKAIHDQLELQAIRVEVVVRQQEPSSTPSSSDGRS